MLSPGVGPGAGRDERRGAERERHVLDGRLRFTPEGKTDHIELDGSADRGNGVSTQGGDSNFRQLEPDIRLAESNPSTAEGRIAAPVKSLRWFVAREGSRIWRPPVFRNCAAFIARPRGLVAGGTTVTAELVHLLEKG
jgi:hypothetical protein